MKILGYEYKIEGVNSDMFTQQGRCYGAGQHIQFDARSHAQGQISTILHEIIEALNYHLHLTLEEKQIMGIEAGLFQTLTEAGIDLTPLIPKEDAS